MLATKCRLLYAGPDELFLPDATVEAVRSAAECAQRAGQGFDAVLIDHSLSEGLIAQLRSRGAGLPIVLIARDDASALDALEAGATDYVIKTGTSTAELATRVRGAIMRYQRTAAAEHAEHRFRGLFEHSPNCLWEEDGSELKRHFDQLRAKGITDFRAYFRNHPGEVRRCMALVKVLDVNQASVRQYEARDKAELIAGLARTLTPESAVVLLDQLVALAEGALLFEAETADQTLGGRKNHIMLKTLVAPGSEQTLAKVYVSIVDITARKLAEHQASALALFPQLNPNPVLQLSPQGAIEYANPASDALAKALGLPLAALLPANTVTLIGDALASGKASPPLETLHNTRMLSWSFHPIGEHQIVHCYIVDITERLQLEEQLRQSQKMDAIGHLAGGIAHDFNNLLTVIYGNTVVLQRKGASEALDSIAQATDRASTLVRQLLAFSRRQVLQIRDLELNSTVVALVKMLARVVREDVEVQLDLATTEVWIRADAGMLDQVLMNLVVNARDAMPQGGKLVLSTSIEWVAEDQVPDLAAGPYSSLRVRDTGIGIPNENLAHIFDPFFTTKELGKGTGLGLATTFGIVKQHGGAIAVESEAGRGTTFTVYLPASRESALQALPPPEAMPRGGPESILVVEDEAPVRKLVQQVLELHGYRVEVVGTGAEALLRGRSFDLVLTDMIMPGGISGRDLATRLRASQPELKFVYMSGYTRELAEHTHELREGTNFLQKPFGPTQLLSCVRTCLDA
ncbi:hypothetical protein BH11MYX1_BH11MYX1_40680 [soil metagenome]